MQGFTLVDGIVVLVIVISAILAYSRGLVREVMAIAGWIAAAIVAFIFAPQAEPLVREIPYLSKYLGDSCELAMIASFAAVFAICLVIVSLFAPLFSSVVQRSALGGVDKSLGFFFGALRGILLVAVAFLVYDRVMAGEQIQMIQQSRTHNIFLRSETQLNKEVPTDVPGWIVARYEQLVSKCNK